MENNNTKIKYFLYARKSSESEDKQVASIEAQISELKKIARQSNLQIVKIFSESRSAKAPGRPIFNEMVERIQKGEANGILCWKLNRLARNPIDGAAIQWMIQQNVIQHIQTYGRSYYPSDNVILMAVELGMANQFIRDLSTDTKRGLYAKAEKGWMPGKAPLGYLNNKFKEKGKKDIIVDVDRFPIVRKMWDLLFQKKYSLNKIYDVGINEWGLRFPSGKKPAKSKIYDMFRNPFYYGHFRYGGILRKGEHKPMITYEEFKKAQQILGIDKPQPKTHYFPFTRLIHCGECNSYITAEEKTKYQKNGNVHHYTYYRCTKRKNPKCSQKPLEEKILNKQITEILESIQIPSEFTEWALEILRSVNQTEADSRNAVLISQQRAYETSVQKIDALIDMRAAGEITEEEFTKKKTQLLAEKDRLQELLRDTDNRINNWLDYAEQNFSFAKTAPLRFENGDIETKREILTNIGSNLFLKEKKLSLDVEKPLLLIKQAAETAKALNKKLEPPKSVYSSTDFTKVRDEFPILGA